MYSTKKYTMLCIWIGYVRLLTWKAWCIFLGYNIVSGNSETCIFATAHRLYWSSGANAKIVLLSYSQDARGSSSSGVAVVVQSCRTVVLLWFWRIGKLRKCIENCIFRYTLWCAGESSYSAKETAQLLLAALPASVTTLVWFFTEECNG